AAAAIDAVTALAGQVGMTHQLADFGITAADFDLIAADALDDEVLANTPRPPAGADIQAILAGAPGGAPGPAAPRPGCPGAGRGGRGAPAAGRRGGGGGWRTAGARGTPRAPQAYPPRSRRRPPLPPRAGPRPVRARSAPPGAPH